MNIFVEIDKYTSRYHCNKLCLFRKIFVDRAKSVKKAFACLNVLQVEMSLKCAFFLSY